MSKKLERSLNIELERLNAKRDVAIGRVEDIDSSISRVEKALELLTEVEAPKGDD